MAYLIGLFVILAVIFSSTGGNHLVGDLWNQLKGKTIQTLFPLTEKEILINNLNSDYQTLDNFFSGSAANILNSKTVSKEDKANIVKALGAFSNSKNLISNLGNLEKKDKSLVKALIDKVLNLDESPSPEPTNIPPQCHLECTK